MNYIGVGSRYKKVRPKVRSYRYRFIFGATVFIFVLLIITSVLNPSWALSTIIKPLSIFSEITGRGKLQSANGRVNILILGLDSRTKSEPGRSDTIIVASIGIKKGDVVIFSIPRDLWIKNYHSKINSLYSVGGVSLVKKTVGDILSIPIHYFVVVDFAGFERAIDSVSGVTVEVERDFDDYRYPIPGRENDECGGSDAEYTCRYQYVSFRIGLQKMDGKTALKFARSRESVGPEGSDFSRSIRQQKIIIALKNKILSLNTFVNPSTISKLYSEYVSSVDTNIGILEAERFYGLSKKIMDSGIKTYVINKDSSGNDLLYNPSDYTPYNGQWVLLPKALDFSDVQAFVASTLFGDN